MFLDSLDMTHSGRVWEDQLIAVGPVTSVGSLLHLWVAERALEAPLRTRNGSYRLDR